MLNYFQEKSKKNISRGMDTPPRKITDIEVFASFFMPTPALAGMGHIAFRCDVVSVRAYVRTCV